MTKIIESNGGDGIFVRMRRTFSLVVSFDDDNAWARIEQHTRDAKRFDCRMLGTNKRKRVATSGHREVVDPLEARETMLRQNGRASLINAILIDHKRTPRF